VITRLQFAMLPAALLVSSWRYRLHVPLGLAPSNVERLPSSLTGGAGSGKKSTPSLAKKLARRKVPEVRALTSGSELAASSSNARVTPGVGLYPPVSDMTITFAPLGPTRTRSRSSGAG
jgi:hypothetical protein